MEDPHPSDGNASYWRHMYLLLQALALYDEAGTVVADAFSKPTDDVPDPEWHNGIHYEFMNIDATWSSYDPWHKWLIRELDEKGFLDIVRAQGRTLGSIRLSLAELRMRLDALTLDETIRLSAGNALKVALDDPSQAADLARSTIKTLFRRLDPSSGISLVDQIGNIGDRLLKSHLHTVRAIGNIGAHEEWDRLRPTDVLPALASMVAVLEWWCEQPTANAGQAGE